MRVTAQRNTELRCLHETSGAVPMNESREISGELSREPYVLHERHATHTLTLVFS